MNILSPEVEELPAVLDVANNQIANLRSKLEDFAKIEADLRNTNAESDTVTYKSRLSAKKSEILADFDILCKNVACITRKNLVALYEYLGTSPVQAIQRTI